MPSKRRYGPLETLMEPPMVYECETALVYIFPAHSTETDD
jgi:hypothetical protein